MDYSSQEDKELLEEIIRIARKAGEAILACYSKNNRLSYLKEDGSPVTPADVKAHHIIVHKLKELMPNIPILSEEGSNIDYNERKKWKKFWLIDPLDGTKEFLQKNGEFTVNIALIENNKPILGVIYVPVSEIVYFAAEKQGSFKCDALGNICILKKPPFLNNSELVRIVGSKSHSNERFDRYVENLKNNYKKVIIKPIGSSLKFCLVAENEADRYPRFGPTMEWDTAAGHAIAKFSGYKVLSLKTQNEFSYNKISLINDEFIVL